MPLFTIRELVTYQVGAKTAQEAMTRFLNDDDSPTRYFVNVEDRTIEDKEGNLCEVDEEAALKGGDDATT